MVTEQDRYTVELFDYFKNDLGEMTEMKLYGYLKSRPLLDFTPEQVLAKLVEKDEVTVHFEMPLNPGKVADVNIRRVRLIP